MARRLFAASALTLALLLGGAGTALACGGLVAPGHAEVLQKATTLAAWHAGYEHYVTGFQFACSASNFGYIVPLPGVPSRIEKAGDWTLERLEREVNPVKSEAFALQAAATGDVQVLQRVTIDALDITVVRGGGPDVAAWAARNGFDLTPDVPTVLGGYASKGAVFALARFNRGSAAGRGLIEGQGTVIHFVIPTRAPWIPLRILALGKAPNEIVDADLFVLTDAAPSFAPTPGSTAGCGSYGASRPTPRSCPTSGPIGAWTGSPRRGCGSRRSRFTRSRAPSGATSPSTAEPLREARSCGRAGVRRRGSGGWPC